VKHAEKDTAKEAKGKGKHSQRSKSAMPEADKATTNKGKHSQKHKSAALEADKPEPNEPKPKVARAIKEIINSRGKHGQKRAAQEADKPEPKVAQIINTPMP
jgi:hypothetical protein